MNVLLPILVNLFSLFSLYQIHDLFAFSCIRSWGHYKQASYLLIGEILEASRSDWKVSVSTVDPIDYTQFVYGQVLLFLKQKINKCHEEGKTSCTIDFSEILYKINEDYRKKLNTIAYQYYMVWRSIQESFESFPRKRTNSCSSDSCLLCADNISCNLYIQKLAISKIEENDIPDFLYRLMLKEPVMGRNNNLPDDDLIHRLFLCLLKEIDNLRVEDNRLIQAQKDGLFYRMTLNSSGEQEELQEQLLNEMKGSADDKLLIYETDVLITDQLNEDVFMINGISTMVFGQKEYNELSGITSDSIEKIKKNYSKPKIIKLIDRKIAKEELR